MVNICTLARLTKLLFNKCVDDIAAFLQMCFTFKRHTTVYFTLKQKILYQQMWSFFAPFQAAGRRRLAGRPGSRSTAAAPREDCGYKTPRQPVSDSSRTEPGPVAELLPHPSESPAVV